MIEFSNRIQNLLKMDLLYFICLLSFISYGYCSHKNIQQHLYASDICSKSMRSINNSISLLPQNCMQTDRNFFKINCTLERNEDLESTLACLMSMNYTNATALHFTLDNVWKGIFPLDKPPPLNLSLLNSFLISKALLLCLAKTKTFLLI